MTILISEKETLIIKDHVKLVQDEIERNNKEIRGQMGTYLNPPVSESVFIC